MTPVVRPDDVLAGPRLVADLAPPSPTVVARLAQGRLDEVTGGFADPLIPDRGSASAGEPPATVAEHPGIAESGVAGARP